MVPGWYIPLLYTAVPRCTRLSCAVHGCPALYTAVLVLIALVLVLIALVFIALVLVLGEGVHNEAICPRRRST